MQAEAHQRKIREERAAADPRPHAISLDGYVIETISRQDAVPLITAYEWLGNIGRTEMFVGLLSPQRELHGVACFGYGPNGRIRRLIGEPALCLERGACTHEAPANAASFLINRACKLVFRITNVARFFAYSDPMAGEYGAVYQAAGWLYLGQGLDGRRGRAERYRVLRPGVEDVVGNWQTTSILRSGKLKDSWAPRPPSIYEQARQRGFRIERRPAKHVYAINVGPDRRRWRAQILAEQCARVGAPLPYPAPRPALKRKPFSTAAPSFL